jgi:formate dehydrogenase
MAVNADEGEPGTFKDRITSRSIRTASSKACCSPPGCRGATVYIYIRDEYPELRLMLLDEIAKLERAGLDKFTRFIFAAAPAPTSAAKNPR